MTTTLLEKARQGRRDALASLSSGVRARYEDRSHSIFDDAFDGSARANIVAFRSSRVHEFAEQEDRVAA